MIRAGRAERALSTLVRVSDLSLADDLQLGAPRRAVISHGCDGTALIDQSTLVELELETLTAFLEGSPRQPERRC